MLTAKENMRQTLIGGKPDRIVNQFEALQFAVHPFMMLDPEAKKGGPNVVNSWGVTRSFPENVPGAFPVHTPETIVCKDIEHWQDYVHAPSLKFPEELWAQCKETLYDPIDRDKAFATTLVVGGLFEMSHHLQGIEEALMNYLLYPDEMHDLIKYLADFELEMAEGICSHLHPEVIFHHDDWGSEANSFLPTHVFEDFFIEPYQQIYKYYKDHGVEFIIHHSDSYGVNLLPAMIEMGIDVWQGCMESNNNAELLKEYRGKIGFMGDIDNKSIDFTGWTQDDANRVARRAIERCQGQGFIPCITQGGPGSVFPGTYQALIDAIDDYNTEKFGFTREEQAAQRMPLQILFG